ncbi:leucine-rich repeat-containing protein 56-like [Haliotis asinina]|uniref:leucine-rich repeat-containing protein 56-like n=1 Tax=Haliotis asinina TaxID=109174 RepID=UPI003531D035
MAVAQNAAHFTRIPNMDPNYERPRSGLARGVQITQLEDSRTNPEPVNLEESDYLLEQYLSPNKLNIDSASHAGPHAEMLSERLLTGVENLEEVHSLEMKVDTTETSLGNFGGLLPNLRQLKLSDSIISGIRDIGSSLRGLRVLWMCRCGLSELDGVASLTSLKELYLSYNDISDISPISMIDTLEILDLEGNYINDVSQIQYLAMCQSLKSLSLEGNPVCLMPHPESQQTNYNYREYVKKVLPNLQVLDEEPLLDGSATDRKPNAFEDDWAYLEELQKDALLMESLIDTVNIGTEAGSRPGTAALRPATAYRPGTALRRPPTSFRPTSGRASSVATRPVSARPITSARPATSARPTTARPSSSESVEVDATSDLTLGNVICGNPSRALKNRRKVGRSTEEELEKDKQRLIAESGHHIALAESRITSISTEDSVLDPSIRQEISEWRVEHDRRMVELEKERAPQVLVVDHLEPTDGLSDSSLTDSDEVDDEDLAPHRVLGAHGGSEDGVIYSQSKFRAPNLGLKHDESFEAEEEEEIVSRSHRRSPSPSLRLQSRRSQSPVPTALMTNGRQLPTPPLPGMMAARKGEMGVVTTATGLPPPVIRTLSNPGGSPSPPTSGGSVARPGIPHPRIRRQLPEVPSLPSRPPVPKS